MMYYNVQETAERIRALRRSRGHSQEDAAQLLGIDRSFFGRVERGDNSCSLDILVRISEVYAVTLDYLIFGMSRAGIPPESLDPVIARLLQLRRSG